MDTDDGGRGSTPPTKKRRIPKACKACRTAKKHCDEQRPCGRCTFSRIDCEFFERPKDLTTERFERIELALSGLNEKLANFAPASEAINVHPSPTASQSTLHSMSTRHSMSVPSQDHTAPLRTNPLTSIPRSGYVVSSAEGSIGGQTGWDESATLHRLWIERNSDTRLSASASSDGKSVSTHPRNKRICDFKIRPYSTQDCVTTGIVSAHDARLFFTTFFSGCNRFVPVFDDAYDTYESVRERSSLLFDTLVIYGCRAASGALSKSYQRLYPLLRQHTSDLVLQMSATAQSVAHSIENIQALLVIASYADSGSVLCDVALRSAIIAGLPDQVDELFSTFVDERSGPSHERQQLYVSARTWFALFVLDQILSLDGGKPPGITLTSPPQRVRALLHHLKNPVDLRLMSQVALNAIRADSYTALAATLQSSEDELESEITSVVTGCSLDLDLWHSEWQDLVRTHAFTVIDREILSVNIRIQHAWALLALHLRALTTCGIENIVLMTQSQRALAMAAKMSAERHLRLLLTDNTPSSTPQTSPGQSRKPYVANFRYAMEFVWAKNAFCVLIVLRLGILLGDDSARLKERLAEAREFLHELEKVGMGTNISYMRILTKTVEKCERAVYSLEVNRASAPDDIDVGEETSTNDFQSFIPKEFMFEWDFPGLNLCYIPLDWQDLFLDFGGTA
ncbi:Hypothetical protein R9X50_00048400 [Acrodontium crateriforme]|uniref:Zn(2)-C6 fungal-type domain-containing protein n=1 Tax=Acrodontium crateriforme TaxID=150365 RepID=A0AAQ3R4Y5_9PEZI|nr:Hypothetical protein R9X50_00048400 [Acrodontium crateriforme]